MAVPSVAQRALERKVDSLFVIASSAELKSRDQVEPAKDSIAALGVDVVPVLVGKFTTKSARERMTIIQIFKRIGSPAVPYLVRSLNLADGLVVQRVCWALGDIGDTAAVLPLKQVSTHPRWQVRDECLGALGDIGDPRAADAVLAGFSDEAGQVRKAAVVAAGKVGLARAIPGLVAMLADDFYGARLSAVEALLQLDTAVVVATLGDSLHSRRKLVGNLACHVLGRIATDHAIELLYAEAHATDPGRRAHALVALVAADPHDNCGFRDSLMAGETDSAVIRKVQSAVYTARNETR
ncbi:MAG: HEAT repeat domain-containing protein [Candidatus Zixiibacteriota bacterium]|nr:MAG: HEAT repeat domain-containing protein [candidate division Zixibacteria bacterium]